MERVPHEGSDRRLPHDWFDRPLPTNVALGERSWLHSTHAFLHYHSMQPRGLTIGRHTGIYHGTFFDLGPGGSVAIGDYCSVVGAIFSTNAHVAIGDYCLIAHEVVIADTGCALPESDCEALSPPGIVIGANVWIGMRAVILGGASVGEGAVIGAAAVVDFEVAPFAIVAGNPARVVGDVRAPR